MTSSTSTNYLRILKICQIVFFYQTKCLHFFKFWSNFILKSKATHEFEIKYVISPIYYFGLLKPGYLVQKETKSLLWFKSYVDFTECTQDNHVWSILIILMLQPINNGFNVIACIIFKCLQDLETISSEKVGEDVYEKDTLRIRLTDTYRSTSFPKITD